MLFFDFHACGFVLMGLLKNKIITIIMKLF